MAKAKLSEAQFQSQVVRLAHLRGWKVAHFRRVRVQRRNGSVYYETPVAADGAGFPDLILSRGDRLVAAELKVGRNQPTAEQSAWGWALIRGGVMWHVWRPELWTDIEETLT